MLIDMTTADHDWRVAYRYLVGCVNPRPIAFVSSISERGERNLAPFSFFNMVSANPPVLMFSAALNRQCAPKHTHLNISATREFVVAIVDHEIGPKMVRAAAELPYGESEFDFAGFTAAPARHVRASLVAEAPVNIECTLRQIVSMGDGPGAGQVIFGDLRAVHIRDNLVHADGQSVDPTRLRSVGRLGGAWYCSVTEPYEMHIPSAEPRDAKQPQGGR